MDAVPGHLLDGDPAVRWQVLRDPTDTTAEEVAAERANVATEGWGARLLAQQRADGSWDGGAYRPDWAPKVRAGFDVWSATHPSLELIRAKRLPIGLWTIENTHGGAVQFPPDEEQEARPSRWITLRALSVLRWWDGRSTNAQTASSSHDTVPESSTSTP